MIIPTFNSLKLLVRECWMLFTAMCIVAVLAALLFFRQPEDNSIGAEVALPGANTPSSSAHSSQTFPSHLIARSPFAFLIVVLPMVIIVVEIYTLNRMLKEQKERQVTTDALKAFRAALGRQNYMDQIALAITTAKADVVFTTATMEASWHSKEQLKIFQAVQERFARDKKSSVPMETGVVAGTETPPAYRHRGIVAKRPETLPGVIELLCLTQIELRMHPVMAMSRLRFLVQDNERCVLGLAEGSHDARTDLGTMPAVEPSRLSFSLDSTMLALSLRWKFDDLWKTAEDPWKYLDDFISAVEPRDDFHTQISILNWLKAEGKKRFAIHSKLLEKCSNYKRLKTAPNDEI
jgi:hypothetical protein